MGPHSISIAVLLLSLTGGTFLLAKANKEELGIYYKVVAWFVIIFSILLILCSSIRGIIGREHRMKNHFGPGAMMFREHRMMGENPFENRSGMREEEENENSFKGRMHHHRGHENGEEKQDTTATHTKP